MLGHVDFISEGEGDLTNNYASTCNSLFKVPFILKILNGKESRVAPPLKGVTVASTLYLIFTHLFSSFKL